MTAPHGLVTDCVVESVLSIPLTCGIWQELCEEVLAAHRTGTRAAAAVRCGEGLMKVHMDTVKSHVSGASLSHDSVQVCSVIVAQPTCLVDDLVISRILLSKIPRVFGLVSISPAVSGPTAFFRASISTHPSSMRSDTDHGKSAITADGRVGTVSRVRNDDLGSLGFPLAL